MDYIKITGLKIFAHHGVLPEEKKNGQELLVVDNVITSCGCTTVEYSKTPVQPEKNLTLKVKYTADRPEYFNKTITVYCNEKDSPILLNISGNAK